MASLEFELAPSESPVSEIISLTTAPRNHWMIVMLKLLFLKHFSLPWMLFEVSGTVFIMNSKIYLRKISLEDVFQSHFALLQS